MSRNNSSCAGAIAVRLTTAVVLGLVLSFTAFAATFTVTKVADTNDGVCDADCSFREAVAAANAAAGDDSVAFDPTVFNVAQTITLSGGAINITGTQALSIAGTGSTLLTIDGSTNGIIFVTPASTATISNLKITGSTGGNTGRIQNNGNLTLNNVVVNNSANSIGLHALFNLGTLTVTGSVFQNNPRTAIFNEGGTINISATTISNNGFGIYNNRGNATVTNSSMTATVKGFYNNEGTSMLIGVTIENNINSNGLDHGGGVVNFSGGTIPAMMTITDSLITGNQANGGSSNGGGIANIAGSLTLTNTTVHNNRASAHGGGVYSSGSLNVTNSTMSGNAASADGAAVYVAGSQVVSISNSTFSRNTAVNNGGGLAVTSGTVNLNHVTIANNNANNSGGGVYRSGGTVNVRNTAIGDNDLIADPTPAGDYVGALTSQGYNLIENGTGAFITGTQTGNIYGQDPEFGRLANSSAPVITRNLLPTSPLIDRADPVNFLPTDQRGIARPQDGDLDGTSRADIGAYERQVNIFTVTKTADTNDGTCDADCSLREAINRSDSVAAPDNVILFDAAVFAVPQTIILTGLGITVPDNGKTLVIDGPGSNLLSVSGNNQNQLGFLVNLGETLLRDVKVTGFKPQTGVSPIRNNGWMRIMNILMTDNSAASRGGAVSNIGRMRIDDSVFMGNAAPSTSVINDGGGAIENDNGTLAVYRSWIMNNTTNARGGGIRTDGFSVTEIVGSVISGNTAVSGGGIYHSSSGSGPGIIITNSTISGNTASGDGGGGMRIQGATQIDLLNVTIARNNASNSVAGTAVGGGVRNTTFGNTFRARNTIIADNTAVTSSPDLDGQLDSRGYNLIENVSGAIFFGDQTGNVLGVDPRIGQLQDNGGPTWTHALLVGSPAIDAAHPTIFPAIDQRGIVRPQDGNWNGDARADIGAFEFHPISDRPAPFDFDGDGKTDIGIFRPSGAVSEWWINRSSNGSTFALQFGASTDIITPGDFTGDGKADIAFFRPASGEWYVLRSEDFSFFALPFGTNGDVPVPADYDADGKADFAIFRPSTSTWFISQSGGGGTRIFQFGVTGDVPVVADYDGDGKADVGIFRQTAGGAEWWINRSTAGLLAMQFGASTDKAVQGDYTGDGKADIAIWRPTDGNWLIVRSEDFSFFGFPFGTTGDVVAPGDYDGDGKFDATVFRPSSATWFIGRTTAGTQIVQFGATGDRPIPNAFVP